MTTCESGSLCFFRPTLALPHLISWDNKRAMMMEMRDPGNKSTCDEASANPSSHLTLVEFSPSSPSSSSSSSFPPLITKTMAPVGFFETLQERRSGRGTPLSAPERERERERGIPDFNGHITPRVPTRLSSVSQFPSSSSSSSTATDSPLVIVIQNLFELRHRSECSGGCVRAHDFQRSVCGGIWRAASSSQIKTFLRSHMT